MSTLESGTSTSSCVRSIVLSTFHLPISTYFSTSPLFHSSTFYTRSRVDHEFEKVAVRIADVRARTRLPTPACPVDRSDFDLHSRVLQPRLQGWRRAVPHEAEVAGRRL